MHSTAVPLNTDATAPSDRHPKAAMIQENRHDDGTLKE